MGLPQYYTQDQSFALMQSRWASLLDRIVDNAMLKGVQLKDISLAVGSNTINHKLQRPYQGYLVTDMKGSFSQLYSEVSPTPALTLILNSSATTTVDILVW